MAAPTWDRIQKPELKAWLQAQPIEFQENAKDRHEWLLERMFTDSMVAEAIGKAHGGMTPAEKAMSDEGFIAHINAMAKAQNEQEQS